MSKTSLHITIPEPCHEDWSKMTATQCGAFCNACQKEVVDFSLMSEAEIVDRLSKASGKVCGRITSDKLDRELVRYEPDHAWYSWKKWAVAAGVLLGVREAKAEIELKQSVQFVIPSVINSIDTISKSDSIKVSGRITDKQGNPLTDAAIYITNLKLGAISSDDGWFELKLPRNINGKKHEVTIRYIGYNDITVPLNTDKDTIVNIVMTERVPTELEIVVVAGGIRRKPTPAQKIRFFFRRIGYAFKKHKD